MEHYSLQETIPLSYVRKRNNALVTGLTVTVVVTDALSNSVLLTSTSCPETAGGSGVYTYNWTHGLNAQTEAVVTFTVGTNTYTEIILIGGSTGGVAV